ncbi:MAG: polyketide cyclase [Armatimonadota bacterium]
MKTMATRFTMIVLLAGALTTLAFAYRTPSTATCPAERGYSPAMQAKIRSAEARLAQYARDEAAVNKNLQTFDTLDFVVFSGQEWVRLHESHAQDVIVNWPDGHHTNGIQKHIEDLKALFIHAPDTQIKVHPVRFGVYRGATSSSMSLDGKQSVLPIVGGDGFTCVTGLMTGTFTKPMPIGDGKFIQPTGKSFSVPMCTVGHWQNGTMTEEWLYWDNATYVKQLGIGQ